MRQEPRILADAFKMEAAEYDQMDRAEGRMWWYRALHARILAALAPVRGTVLDIGCGTGGLLARIGCARPDLGRTGLDYAPVAATRAADKAGCAVACGSAAALPFASAQFDAAILADVLCHAAVDPDVALSEAARVLRPGGRLIVNMPAYRWLASAHDRRVHNARRQSAAELRATLARAGFAEIRARYWNGLLLPLMIVRRKLRARGDAASDVAPFPPWLDAIFHAITVLERRVPALPAGGSVLATALRP